MTETAKTIKSERENADSEMIVDRCDCVAIHADVVTQVNKHMPEMDMLDRLADVFKVFGDPTRVKILTALSKHEMCVCDIAVLLNMTVSAISHQLRILRQARLVKFRKDGRSNYYSLDDSHVESIMKEALEHIAHSGGH